MNVKKCPICDTSAQYEVEVIEQDDGSTVQQIYQCVRCRRFIITSQAEHFFTIHKEEYSPRTIANISSWLAENELFRIDSKNLKNLIEIKNLPIQEKVHKLLLHIEKKTTYIGEVLTFKPKDDQLQSLTWSINPNELRELFNYLLQSNYIEIPNETTSDTISAKITIHGFSYIEKIRHLNIEIAKGFVAMWFAKEMNTAYIEAIYPAIEAAGYDPVRIDYHEHNNDITDEIIAQIRRSKFLIADYTGHRGGVYYEAGFARGLGIEVFMTCRKDHMKDLHFDVNHQVCIEWTEDSLDDFKKKLTNKIEAIIGRGPHIKDE